ncbi:2-dehydropantoate 2-reductase [compost metagenome]
MEFHVIGAGALGLLYGAKLSLAGHHVKFHTRTEEQAIRLNVEGIILSENGESIHINSNEFKAYSIVTPLQQLENSADWIIIAVKQWQVDDDLIAKIKNLALQNAAIVCLQNGIGLADTLIHSNIKNSVYSIVTTEGAKRTQNNEVLHTGRGNTIIGAAEIGNKMDKNRNEIDEKGKLLAEIFSEAGFTAFLSNKIDKEIYKKLLINSIINPLTAIWRISNGELLATPQRQQFVKLLCQETDHICKAHHISIDFNLYEQVQEVCKATFGNTSSMLYDILQGNETEVDYINGYLVKLALDVNIKAPMHDTITQLVKGMKSF